jgi:hypothetical protein
MSHRVHHSVTIADAQQRIRPDPGLRGQALHSFRKARAADG